MIDIKHICWFDIETVGCAATFSKLLDINPKLYSLWNSWYEKHKLPGDISTVDEAWLNKAGLHAEYAKVVCVSFGYFDNKGDLKINSFHGHDEKEILEKTAKVLNNANTTGMYLGGHSIERFDIAFLWKRMFINGITPPALINVWEKKPWDLKFFDIAKVWSNGSWKESFTSLDTMAAVFNVQSPKDDLKGALVHDYYWSNNDTERIKEYCENDVRATAEIGKLIINILIGKQNESVVYQ